ncbi:MAG: RsmB/NOP family class I SAM-dependent RNA methyltransferase [Erythrobacter sp.]
MAEPSGIHARRAALHLLDAVIRRGQTLDQSFHSATRTLRKPADKALARALVSESLRWLTDLDGLIDSATKNNLPDDAKPRNVLRLMLAGWLRLHTPPHAVIATGLPLLSGGQRKLAHGVFSNLDKQNVRLPDVPSLPAFVAERWGDTAPVIAAGLVNPPPLDLTLADHSQTGHWTNQLSGDSLMPGHVRLPRGSAVEDLAGFGDKDHAGAWWVQDIAASLPARLLGNGAEEGGGKHVLDLCAAPGGKTLQLAAQGWKVTALDISKRRLELLKDNLKRTGLKASPLRADALKWEPKHQYDAILLDAPCTATGTCRRHPDVLHRIGQNQIAEMTQLQAQLIERATGWLKPGGVMIYAVCSLEHAEGEAQAANVALTPDPIRSEELPEGIEPTEQGWLRTHPGMLADVGGLDGFFVARWRKP